MAGTAPRKIGGSWYTAKGRKLSDAGQAYWERKKASGQADGKGGYVAAKRHTFGELVTGGPKVAAEQKAYAKQHPSHLSDIGKAAKTAGKVGYAGSVAAPIEHAIRHPSVKAIAEGVPVFGTMLQAGVDTDKAALAAGRRAGKGKAPSVGQALALAGLIPGFPKLGRNLGRVLEEAAPAAEQATRVTKVADAGLVGRRTLTAGDRVQQINARSRSRLTRAAVDNPADAISQKYPNAPIAGARSRVLKYAGREQKDEARRARVALGHHVDALPKRGSNDDVAHFWWAQLPTDMRNTSGLKAVRTRLATELEHTVAAPSDARGKLIRADQPQRAVDLSAAVARLDQVIKANPKLNPRTIEAVSALSSGRRSTLEGVGLLNPENASDREQLVTRWLTGAKYEKPTAAKLGKPSASLIGKRARVERLQTLYDRAVARAGDKTVSLPDVQERILARRVTPEGIAAGRRKAIVTSSPSEMVPKGTYTPTVERLGAALSVAKDELKSHEAAALRRVKPTGVLGGKAAPGGGEIFIGHRQDTPRGAFGLRSPGVGKPKKPQGVGQENKMELLSSGRVRMSTHVAAEDWHASETYKDTIRARDTLAQIGEPLPHVEGEIPDKPIKGYLIVNPHGDPVPRNWKIDRLAHLSEGGGSDDLHAAAKEVLHTFIGDQNNWGDIVQSAKDAGVANDLRIISEKDAHRFYRQFLPMARATTGGRVYDKMIDATAASIIFARVGYIPKNLAQNIILAIPHQGPRLLMNAPRAGQLIPHPGQSEIDRHLWRLLSSEAGGGVSGSIAQESSTRLLGKPAQIVTSVADSPFRISAILHEFANEGVIPKWSTHLSEQDKERLIHVLTDPAERGKLNEAMQTARDGMGDFDRLDPTQKRWARRFLIVPGWLAAGTRYPFKFAASYPGRTAGLAYLAAGEPGSPHHLNKPVDEYLRNDLPNWVEGVGVGGKTERVSSLLPASIPADIALRARKGQFPLPGDYRNPFPETVYNIAKSQRSGPSGSYHVPLGQAITGNLEGLAPGEKFVRDMISPPKNPRTYPGDKTRLGRLERETGVLPIEIARNVPTSKKAMDSAVTMTKNLGIGKNLRPAVAKSYARLAERDEAWKKASHGKKPGTREYEVARYRADIQLAQKWGYMDAKTVAQVETWTAHAPIQDIRKAHLAINEHQLGAEFSAARETSKWLTSQTNYAADLGQAVRSGKLTKAQAAKAQAWARTASAKDIEASRLILDRELAAAG